MLFTERETIQPALDSSVFVNLICYRHQKHNLMTLRDIVGDKGLVTLLDRFAGTYIRFPTASHTLQTVNEVYLAMLYQDLKTKAKGTDPMAWHNAEKKFAKFAERIGYTILKARKLSKNILKELDEANKWWTEIKRWEVRNAEKD